MLGPLSRITRHKLISRAELANDYGSRNSSGTGVCLAADARHDPRAANPARRAVRTRAGGRHGHYDYRIWTWRARRLLFFII